MREFIGHIVKLAVQELGMVEGTVINDTQTFLFIKGKDGKITRVVKGKICAFTPMDFEPCKYIPFHVLRCWNDKTGCQGVQYIQEGDGFKQGDFNVFMDPCPCKSDSCGFGTKGELRTADGEFLGKMFKDIMFGDYPKKKIKT